MRRLARLVSLAAIGSACVAAVAGCGSAAGASRHAPPAVPPRIRARRSRLRRPLRVPSHVELRRHPRAVVELRGSGIGRRRPPAHPARLAEDAITGVRTRRRVVALSFDDGPNPAYTPKVLALLRAYGAHATFFTVGASALAHRDLVRGELAAGNEVGNHTFDHPHLPALSGPAIALEMADGTRAVEAASGLRRLALFRPPFGQFDGRVASLAAHSGQRIVLWSLNLERLEKLMPIRAAAETILKRVRPGDIILCHDGVPPPTASLAARFMRRSWAMVQNRQLSRGGTLAALPPLLAGLRSRGYQVVTVSSLLRLGPAIQQGLDAINDPWQYRRSLSVPGRPAER